MFDEPDRVRGDPHPRRTDGTLGLIQQLLDQVNMLKTVVKYTHLEARNNAAKMIRYSTVLTKTVF